METLIIRKEVAGEPIRYHLKVEQKVAENYAQGAERDAGTVRNGSIEASTSRFLDDVVTHIKQVSTAETKAFRYWVGDNKIVDENAEMLKVYHGTNISLITINKNQICMNW